MHRYLKKTTKHNKKRNKNKHKTKQIHNNNNNNNKKQKQANPCFSFKPWDRSPYIEAILNSIYYKL